jgi:hypothetical protein
MITQSNRSSISETFGEAVKKQNFLPAETILFMITGAPFTAAAPKI